MRLQNRYFLVHLRLDPPRRTDARVHQDASSMSQLPSVTTCSDNSKPYMMLNGLDESYMMHEGFAIIRAGGE